MKKTVLITGASRGIGRATAIAFAKEDYRVVINYFQSVQPAQQLQSALQEQGYDVLALQADVSNKKDVNRMIREVKDTFGTVDILVNNAGISQQKLFTDTTEEDWDHLFDYNVKACYYCSQAVLPDMLAKKRGKIINISSIWGICGASCEVAYSASKAAVIGLTKALAKELGPSNIQVNCVAPGVINTDMNRCLDEQTLHTLCDQTPLCRLGSPEDIASAILFLADAKADFITGQIFSPNGGFLI